LHIVEMSNHNVLLLNRFFNFTPFFFRFSSRFQGSIKNLEHYPIFTEIQKKTHFFFF